MTNEPRTSQSSSTRKQDVDALLADLSLDMKSRDITRKSTSNTRPTERRQSPARPDDAQSLLDDLEGLVQRRRSMQRDTDHTQNQNSPQKSPITSQMQPAHKTRMNTSPMRPAKLGTPSPAKPASNLASPSPKNPTQESMPVSESKQRFGSTPMSVSPSPTGSGPPSSSPVSAPTKGKSAQSDAASTDSASHLSPQSQMVPSTTTQDDSGTSPSKSSSTSETSQLPNRKDVGGWGGWGSLFSTASKFAEQARDELGRRTAAVVQHTPTVEKGSHPEQQIYEFGNKFAQRVRGFVQDGGLEQIRDNITAAGRRGWNDIVNAVVLPMEAHDSVNVTVSHGM